MEFAVKASFWVLWPSLGWGVSGTCVSPTRGFGSGGHGEDEHRCGEGFYLHPARRARRPRGLLRVRRLFREEMLALWRQLAARRVSILFLGERS